MPQDDTESQREHARVIRSERAMMDMTGLSRSQIRHLEVDEGLREFADQIRARPRTTETGKPEPPKIQSSQVSLEPTPLLGPGRRPDVQPITGSAEDLDLWRNGILVRMGFLSSGAASVNLV